MLNNVDPQHSSAVNRTQDPLSLEIVAWLEAFAAAVRAVDYDAGRRLFTPEVVGFGTIGVMLNGIDPLVSEQWKKVWGVTRGFHFHLERLRCSVSADSAWAAVPWTSRGCGPDGAEFDRHGRGTYILQRRIGKWLAVHTHHSLNPEAPEPARPRVIT